MKNILINLLLLIAFSVIIAEEGYEIPMENPAIFQHLSISDEFIPRSAVKSRVEIIDEHEIVGVPDYVWTYGCYPTCLGMLVAYWVNNNEHVRNASGMYNIYPPFLEDPNKAGNTISDPQLPMDNFYFEPHDPEPHIWTYVGDDIIVPELNCPSGQVAECPFIASRKDIEAYWKRDDTYTFIDLSAETGHVENSWKYFGDWDKDTQFDCIADFVRTSMYDLIDGETKLPVAFMGIDGNDNVITKFQDYMRKMGGVDLHASLFESICTQTGLNMNFWGTIKGPEGPIKKNPDYKVIPEREKRYKEVKDEYLKTGMSWERFKSQIDNNQPVILLIAREENTDTFTSAGKKTVTQLVGHHAVLAYGFKETATLKVALVKTTYPGNPEAKLIWDGYTPFTADDGGLQGDPNTDKNQYYGIMNAVTFAQPSPLKRHIDTENIATETAARNVGYLKITEGSATQISEYLPSNYLISKVEVNLYHSGGIKTVLSEAEMSSGELSSFTVPSGYHWKMTSNDEIVGYLKLYSGDTLLPHQVTVLVKPTVLSAPEVNILCEVKGRNVWVNAENRGGIAHPSMVKWNFGENNGAMHRGFSTMYTFDKPGVYTVSLRAEGLNGAVSTDTKSIVISDNVSTVIANNIKNNAVIQTDGSMLQLALQEAVSDARVEIFSIKGQKIQEVRVGRISAGLHRIDLNEAKTLAAGAYFAMIHLNEKVYSSKFIQY